MSSIAYDQHAEAVMLEGPSACPFDCAACEAAMMRHTHPAACGHPATCYSPDCFEDASPNGRPAPVVACTDCQPKEDFYAPCDPFDAFHVAQATRYPF